MRLFTALELPSDLITRLEEVTRELKPAARLKWSPAENLHITTKFIGDWPGECLEQLRNVMPIDQAAPHITVRGTGFFPNDRFPRIFFARVEPTPELLQLASATDRAVSEVGVPPEKHPYRPHVTLARIPESLHLHPMRDRLAELTPGLFGSFLAADYSLFESNSGCYTKLTSFSLRAGNF